MASAIQKEYKTGAFRFGRCHVIVTIDDGRWHLSISGNGFSPSYKELKAARYKFLPPDKTFGQLFPPLDQFINLHEFCYHLWEIRAFEM